MKNKIKICDYCWHVAHAYDLYTALKDDVECDMITTTWRDWEDPRFLDMRPIPDNVHFVPYYEPGKYDLAILHIDQSIVEDNLGKTAVFRELRDNIKDIPKIVINHGTPCYPEFAQQAGETAEEARMKIVEFVKKEVEGCEMVVNSYDAASEKEWGWGTPIIHGMDPDLWYDLEKEPRLFTALSPKGWDTYYNRMYLGDVVSALRDMGHTLHQAKVNALTERNNFEIYRRFLGRSLIYFDPSLRTPMNRGRTEAFLSGCCVVQTEGAHDINRWGKNGENMIIAPKDPEATAKLLVELVENHYSECVAIGQNGKAMAQKEFSPIRYRQDWMNVINKVLNK